MPTSQVTHQLISGFCNIKRLGTLLLPPGWDASPSQGNPRHDLQDFNVLANKTSLYLSSPSLVISLRAEHILAVQVGRFISLIINK